MVMILAPVTDSIRTTESNTPVPTSLPHVIVPTAIWSVVELVVDVFHEVTGPPESPFRM